MSGLLISACCGCECTPCTDNAQDIITLEPMGSGYVMLIGDDDVIFGAIDGSAGRNAQFWQNVAAFIGNGTVGGLGSVAWNPSTSSVATGMEPTVNVTSSALLATCAAVWTGWHTSGTPQYTLYGADPYGVGDWVRAGGLLIAVQETDAATSGAGAISTRSSQNAMLAGIGSCSRFTGGDYDTAPTTAYLSATLNTASPLIDGTFGSAVSDVRFSRTSCVCAPAGGHWIARRP